jgi:hypothetical protein
MPHTKRIYENGEKPPEHFGGNFYVDFNHTKTRMTSSVMIFYISLTNYEPIIINLNDSHSHLTAPGTNGGYR